MIIIKNVQVSEIKRTHVKMNNLYPVRPRWALRDAAFAKFAPPPHLKHRRERNEERSPSPLAGWGECLSWPWHACQAAVPNQPREKPSARAALLNFNDSLCCGGAPLCPFIRRARKELIGQKMEGQGELTSH